MIKEGNKTSLWTLIVSPFIWGLHLLACYITTAIWCAKAGRDSNLDPVRIAIFIFTALALPPIGMEMVKSYRKHRTGNAKLPHDDATPEDRERFLGFSNFLISSLSAIAVLFVAFNAVIFQSCD